MEGYKLTEEKKGKWASKSDKELSDILKENKEKPIDKDYSTRKKNIYYGMYNMLFPYGHSKYTLYTFLTNLEWGLRSKGILKPTDTGLV